MKDIETATAATLAYFDVFDRPLTREELERWTWEDDGLCTAPWYMGDKVENKDGYYCVKGRGEIIPVHQARVWIVEKKMRIAVRAAKKIRWVPFVRGVFVSNTVAMGTPREESDVDFFVVVKDGHVWTARLCITLLLTFFRLRRHGEHVSDRVCLCFYMTDLSLDFSDIRMFPDDIYLVYWIDQLVPVFDPHNISERICAENAWARRYIPNALLPRATTRQWRAGDAFFPRTWRMAMEFFLSGTAGAWCEQTAKRIQAWKMAKNTNSLQSSGDTRVVVNDRMLKFHENDRRRRYYEEWKKTRASFAES